MSSLPPFLKQARVHKTRLLVAGGAALLAHLVFAFFVTRLEARVWVNKEKSKNALTFELTKPPSKVEAPPKVEEPPPKVEEPPPKVEAPPPKVEAPPPVEAPPVEAPPVEAPPPKVDAPPPKVEAPPVEVPAPEVKALPPEGPQAQPTLEAPGDSPVRLKKRSALDDAVTGPLGSRDPFGTKLGDLEKALTFKAEGPQSDLKRAQSRGLRNLNEDLARADIESGMSDDYFRVLKKQILLAWRPSKKDLVTGEGAVSRIELMKNAATSDEAWREMWSAYLDVARQYAKGQKLHLGSKRKEKLRELMRSRKGAYRFSAVLEVVITQAPGGELLTIDTKVQSGHPVLDENARKAISKAILTLQDKPPKRLSRGYNFRSRWRLRATWKMVPPTSFLTGSAFDISRKGIEADLPFQMKILKNALLLEYQNKKNTKGE